MDNRQPTYPGRVLLKDVETGEEKLYDMTMADEPINPGTTPTKENLLDDSTEKLLFGKILNKTVNDAFVSIGQRLNLIAGNLASITVTVVDQQRKPLEGVIVDGVLTNEGNTATTNSEGKIVGVINEGEITLQIKDYADIEDYSDKITIEKGQSYTKEIQATTRDFLKVTSSKNVRFSGNVSRLDACIVGAGGGAGGSVYSSSKRQGATGGAGGGGEVVTRTEIPFSSNLNYAVKIGAGGTPGEKRYGSNAGGGNPGGNTSFIEITAQGGKPGTGAKTERVNSEQNVVPGVGGAGYNGAGKGANGVWGNFAGYQGATLQKGINGQDGTQVYKSFTETEPLGAGGGSGSATTNGDTSGGLGGRTGGGSGGQSGYGTGDRANGTAGEAGSGSGGGSGASTRNMDSYTIGTSAKGGSGCVAMRMHLKSAV